jgi:hypothetical protein
MRTYAGTPFLITYQAIHPVPANLQNTSYKAKIEIIDMCSQVLQWTVLREKDAAMLPGKLQS